MLYNLGKMILNERLRKSAVTRVPEPDSVMSTRDQVESFAKEGDFSSGSAVPLYLFNALAISSLAPPQSKVVDLGCGAGQFASFLSLTRPDLKIYAIDLSEEMIKEGQKLVKERGQDQKITFLKGNMTDFSQLAPKNTSVVYSMLSLHHLREKKSLFLCLEEIRKYLTLNANSKAWIFDVIRPKNSLTASLYPKVFSPKSSETFKEDAENSLLAAFTTRELQSALTNIFAEQQLSHLEMALLPIYQSYCINSQFDLGSLGQQKIPPFVSVKNRVKFYALLSVLKLKNGRVL